MAFAAGTLATTMSIARSDAVKYAEKLQDGEYKETVEDAKRWLKSTIKKVNEIELNSYEFLKCWIGEDERILHIAIEFFKKVKNAGLPLWSEFSAKV